jgi:hypothetical protein
VARNVAVQVLRGVKANMPALADGEFAFAEDTGELFVGFFGGKVMVARMAVPIQDSAGNPLTSTAGALDINIKSNTDTPLPVSGTVAVSNFPATQPVSGTVAVSGTTQTTQVGGASGLVGDTQAKGVQGTIALMVQEFKDSGRVIKAFTAQFTAAATEAMVTLTPVSDGVVGTTGTSFPVSAGKRFRIEALLLTCFNVTAAIHACQVNLRMSSTGAVTTASPIIATVATTTAAATIGLASSQAQTFADGIELSGTMQFGISEIGIALAGQTVVLVGYEY